MYERERTVSAVPSWMIVDSQHRRKYPLGALSPFASPRRWVASGHLKQGNTIGELAQACAIDGTALTATVARFNDMAARGVDDDFGRGAPIYDNVFGDPTNKPNTCLGTISKPPYYALALYPGDVGMAGGLVTDEHGAVLREDGTPIEGLYASGCTAASAMGRMYVGGGISLGQSSVFGFLAAEHMAARALRDKNLTHLSGGEVA
jgi:3-oxosteroid 1-dehydrogenase